MAGFESLNDVVQLGQIKYGFKSLDVYFKMDEARFQVYESFLH